MYYLLHCKVIFCGEHEGICLYFYGLNLMYQEKDMGTSGGWSWDVNFKHEQDSSSENNLLGSISLLGFRLYENFIGSCHSSY